MITREWINLAIECFCRRDLTLKQILQCCFFIIPLRAVGFEWSTYVYVYMPKETSELITWMDLKMHTFALNNIRPAIDCTDIDI